ncbi:MAG: Jag N-terminal domain-containing protein [Oscillospiraceae bacterium]|nr:Jag N-terminal domain-containing protein [Oscillospiraceae bacterium]
MGREIIKEGNSVNEAIDLACMQLGITRDEANFEILTLPKKAFWGFKSVKAKVKVVVADLGEKNSLTIPSEIADEKIAVEKVIETLEDYLRPILKLFGLLEVKFKVTITEKSCVIGIETQDEVIPLFERNNWELVGALQHIGNIFLNQKYKEVLFPRIVLNLNDHMKKKEERLEKLVRNVAQVVLKTGADSTLEPMCSYDRMLVHSVISEISGLGSSSVGTGSNRRVVVFARKPAIASCGVLQK